MCCFAFLPTLLLAVASYTSPLLGTNCNTESTTTTSPSTTPAIMAFKLEPVEMLTLYGLTLMVCGALAFQESGLKPEARSAIYVGNGGALISFLTAAGVRNLKLKKGEPGYMLMMIAVHWAVVFPLIIATALGVRLTLAWNVPAKAYLKPYFSIMIAMSLATSAVLVMSRPKKNAPEEEEATPVAGAAASASGAASKTKQGDKGKTKAQ